MADVQGSCDDRFAGVREALEQQLDGDELGASVAVDLDGQTVVDRAPWVPLYNPRALTALSARVGNYQYHPFWQVLLDQLWVR